MDSINAGRALAMIGGDTAITTLVKGLTHTDHYFRTKTLLALEHARDERVIAPLVAMISRDDTNKHNSLIAQVLCIKPKTSGTARHLITHVKNPEPKVRAIVVKALGHAGDRRMLPRLIEMRNDRSREVREAVRKAISVLEEFGH